MVSRQLFAGEKAFMARQRDAYFANAR